jgi:hypothetical protein
MPNDAFFFTGFRWGGLAGRTTGGIAAYGEENAAFGLFRWVAFFPVRVIFALIGGFFPRFAFRRRC